MKQFQHLIYWFYFTIVHNLATGQWRGGNHRWSFPKRNWPDNLMPWTIRISFRSFIWNWYKRVTVGDVLWWRIAWILSTLNFQIDKINYSKVKFSSLFPPRWGLACRVFSCSGACCIQIVWLNFNYDNFNMTNKINDTVITTTPHHNEPIELLKWRQGPSPTPPFIIHHHEISLKKYTLSSIKTDSFSTISFYYWVGGEISCLDFKC